MAGKIVFQTRFDGVYVGPVEADESPLEPDVFLIPAGCVEEAPPSIPEGHFARWTNAGWLLEQQPEELPEVSEPETPESIQRALEAGVQIFIDTKAQEAGYDNIISAITYADEPAVPKFQQEGLAFRAWRSLVWAKCAEVQNAVIAGERPIPTLQQLIDELPVLTLPQA